MTGNEQKPAPATVRCCDGCGNEGVIPEGQQVPPGWYYLELTKRVRCPPCARQLQEINSRA